MVVLEVPIAPTSVVTMVGALDDNSTRERAIRGRGGDSRSAKPVDCDDSARGITYQLEQRLQRKDLLLRIAEYDVVID